MPELSVPRANNGFPAMCILTGQAPDVQEEDLILSRRSAAIGWGLIGFLTFGWIGAMLASSYLTEKCPIRCRCPEWPIGAGESPAES